MRILAFYQHYLPGYQAGGPVTSLANLIEALGDQVEFFVVSLDHDLSDGTRYPDIKDGWNPVGKGWVRYLANDEANREVIGSIIREVRPDKLYLNSFFDQTFSRKVIMGGWRGTIPIMLAPRGEFSSGALAQKSFKKRLYIGAWKFLRLSNDIMWHASTEFEAGDIGRVMGSVPVRVASDIGPVGKSLDWHPREEGAPLRVCFLSRIAPMKNLIGALKSLSQVRAPVDFDIFGPKEDAEYWRECEGVIASLPAHVNANYRGPVHRNGVQRTIGAYDLFFLPTLGENYGHVVAEALGAGVPVLLSDKTPWQDVEEHGVGWTAAKDSRYPEVIEEVATASPTEQREVHERCVGYAIRKTASNEIVEANRDLFLS